MATTRANPVPAAAPNIADETIIPLLFRIMLGGIFVAYNLQIK